MLQREGFTQNVFEKSGNPVPTTEGQPSLTYVITQCVRTDLAFLAWTFAKQKWQRTKGAYTYDPTFRTAVILPGYQEKLYE